MRIKKRKKRNKKEPKKRKGVCGAGGRGEASHLESGPVLDSIFRETELHVDLFPPHAHHDPLHPEVGICGLDGVTDDLSFWDLDLSVAEAGVVGEELDIQEAGLFVAHRRGHTLEVGGESSMQIGSRLGP